MGKTHENVFPGAHCYENFRLLSETFLPFCHIFHGFYSVILKEKYKIVKFKNNLKMVVTKMK